ncbi:MAG: PQQ-binding-like beta-propeller repeat protein [Pirellulaceae bacterium]
MNRRFWPACLGAWVIWLGISSVSCAEPWPGWRGPRGDGTSQEQGLPTKWNGETGDGIVWKTRLAGWGHSSPIVWQDAVFVTECREEDQSRRLLRLSALDGSVVWERTVLTTPLEKRHKLNSHASGTPLTDGKKVYVSFLSPDFGSTRERTPGDLVVAAYDLDGTPRWQVRAGRFASVHGFCSSPILFEDTIIINGDHDGDGYLVALSRDTGETVWRVDRPNHTRSYVTPIIREFEGRQQLLLSGSKCVASYDPRNGSQHWYLDGPTEQFVASLVDNGRLVFLTAGFPDKHILAVRPSGHGTLSDDSIVWRTTKNCAYVPSPVICGDYLLLVSDNGIASCYHADEGKLQWVSRLDTMNHSASLVTAEGRVYFLADNGVTRVVRPGPAFEQIAANPLGEDCYASPAISGGRLYVRGRQHLFCIGPAATGE